ncbi:anthrax toxin-like adenylyl cyclase domain-containing protein [Mucilaginibacter sp.]|jgi:hypothetical protein|uniref:anthrax toxin-like adenylyl cyclase domain-containing protein n=1 Tax=Mucilaginibacter sp. TaxID=1882438 RepID=UPI0035629538
MPTELTADPAYTSPADYIASSWLTDDIYKEVKAQGFPGYMCYSFMQTARTTNSVILSRLPGGVGLDLIEKGYDLKGFHIKAKSCNWGPMAGFICQLPVFNKLGIGKADYNAKEVVHYLKHLASFSDSKKIIEEATARRDKQIAAITVDEPAKGKEIARFNSLCDQIVVETLLAAKEKEETGGEWSGENAIQTKYPFIALKREFDMANLKKIRGIEHFLEIDKDTIYGVAQNVTNESGGTNRPTVITEFLLKRDAADATLWNIYHGRIKYKNSDDPAVAFDKNFAGEILKDKFDKEFVDENEVLLGKIFAFEKGNELKFNKSEDLAKFRYSVGGKEIFPPPATSHTFYVVQGFVNPYPPFKLPVPDKPAGKDEYYKNAVSGDYDLFANWPKMSINQDELTRQSEFASGEYNRLGGKIFTTYVGNRNNFGIEFVPGFDELNAKAGVSKLKESAEFGNMNSLCHTISGVLNSNAAYFLNVFNGVISNANKGFHSDEGGRPGIMEIEFPIAVFLPKKMESAALNNAADDAGKVTPTLHRSVKYLGGGLIKSAEELVMLIIECMDADFRVFMHYKWMVHLLYNTIESSANAVVKLNDTITKNLEAIRKFDDKFDRAKSLKEFTAIDANRAVIDKYMVPSTPLYVENLKKILKCDNDESDLFNQIIDLFFGFNFLSNMLSFDKRMKLEKLMNETKVKPATPVTPA